MKIEKKKIVKYVIIAAVSVALLILVYFYIKKMQNSVIVQPGQYTASPSILDNIKGQENCVLSAYQDGSGIWTIGYGHTGSDVYQGLVITQEQANDLFLNDIQKFVNVINRVITVPITQGTGDAALDLEYNTGALSSSEDFVNMINNGADAETLSTWMQAHYITQANGLASNGLQNRRNYDASLITNIS